MSEKQYTLMIDPTPSGWAYGFPKALPKEAVGGTGYDLFIVTSFDLTKWVVEQGYPEEHFQHYRLFVQEVEYFDEYYQPGGDCQL